MKFPYGVSDFRQVIGKGYYFVDRSDPAGLRAAGEGGGIEQSVGPGRPGGWGWPCVSRERGISGIREAIAIPSVDFRRRDWLSCIRTASLFMCPVVSDL